MTGFMVDFITVTYGNMFDCVSQLVKSIYRFTTVPFRIIIVNNGSTDRTLELSDIFPDVKIINLSENQGLIKALNIAVKHVNAPYVVRVDHDAEVVMPWEILLEHFERDSKVAIVGPRIIFPDNTLYSGQFYFSLRKKRLPFLKIKNGLRIPPLFRSFFHGYADLDTDTFTEVVHVTGTFMVIRCDVLKKFKFNEKYIDKNGDFEDMDFTLMVAKNKYKVIYDGRVQVLHRCMRSPEYKKSMKLKNNRQIFKKIWRF